MQHHHHPALQAQRSNGPWQGGGTQALLATVGSRATAEVCDGLNGGHELGSR
eukprot:CAMPEP_0167830848 /NCGR_PEP_ID=MMETSP0112_2-20121227/13221_1 /TAXON_ID=91324 /ORGANISM="Lotharella globosa, Strain CCCM811" /LENGTH=51 /DNA_ID=CAMNT_0007735255 /DNA_START=96 /DNA_END=247 /DNA_ORIENTATION=-